MRRSVPRPLIRNLGITTLAAALVVGTPLMASAATYPSDSTPPNIISDLSGFNTYWTPDTSTPAATAPFDGTVLDPATLATNDALAVWINNNATTTQQFHAIQDSEYNNATNTAYDQSFTIGTALGSTLERIYVQGRQSGALPLTSALINNSTGTSGNYVSTSAAKANFSYPRPYLPTSATAAPANDTAAANCPTDTYNGSALTANRVGKPYANAEGDLAIRRVADTVDSTGEFSSNSVPLSASYDTTSLCSGGSFPSGHTTNAYESAITLATLLPELAPEILARASENGNDRIVLGVHYPLDIMGGRIDGEAALATRWSDPAYVSGVLEPARQELVNYLQAQCGGTLASCIANETAYQDDPYGGAAMPGGTAQIVTNRASAVSVYRERMTYGFAQSGTAGLAASVPAGAENLLLTTFPTLTDAQRTAVLAQTEIASGYPLDGTGTANGSWERLDLAAATSATVHVAANGTVLVTSTGGTAQVVTDPAAPVTTTPTVHLPVVSG